MKLNTPEAVRRVNRRALIAALAERYDGHPGVAYIELGSLGRDGEWTVDLDEEGLKLPTSAISREYAWHYTSTFEQTLMLMRRPYMEANLLSVGLYNPDLGDLDATWSWLDTAELGGYDKQIETDLVAMPEFFKESPAGAHISSEIDLEALVGEKTDVLARQIFESHLSYVVLEQDPSGLKDETLIVLRQLDSLIGYRLWLRSAEWDSRLHAGIRSKVILTFRNAGAAPLHAAWPIALALFDGEEMIWRQITEADTSMLPPGDNEITVWIDIPSMAEVGSYTLKLAILDPDSDLPGIQLANAECDGETLWMELGELQVIGGWRDF